MRKLRVSVLAEQDLDNIWHYVATESGSIEIANGFLDSLTSYFPLFCQITQAGTLRDEIAEGVRGFPARNYIIYYRLEDSTVLISRVLHGSRDQASAYKKRK